MLYEKKSATIEEGLNLNPELILAIKLNGKKNSNIHVYEEGKFIRTIKKPWKDAQGILWRKLKIRLKFPADMDYEERKKWRREHKKLERNPDYQPNELYLKWDSRVERLVDNK
jgi:hypothetical protein